MPPLSCSGDSGFADSGKLYHGAEPKWYPSAYLYLEQMPGRRFRPWSAPEDPPDKKNDQLLCGRECGIRKAASERGTGSGPHSQELATRIQMAGMGIPAFFYTAGYGRRSRGQGVRVFAANLI